MTLRLTRRGRVVQRLGMVVVGAVFGILVSAVNHGFGPASEYVSKVIGNGWIWLAAGLGACLLGRSWKQSWAYGVTFFWPAVAGYYLADIVAGVYTSRPFDDPTVAGQFDLMAVVVDIIGYVVVSAAASALLTLVVVASRRGGIVGILGAVAVPGYIAIAALTLHRGLEAMPANFHDPIQTTVTWYLGLTALVVTALVVVARTRHHLGPRSGPVDRLLLETSRPSRP